MVFHVLTLFPAFFEGPFGCGVIARASEAGRIEIRYHDLREHTFDRHRTVDDRPFGGDEGMVMKVEPVCRALETVRGGWKRGKTATVLLSAQGRLFDQVAARRFADLDEIALICGRYEGVDERVAEHLADEEISVGSFVLSGGEWACGIVIDAVTRLLPGVLGNEASSRRESFESGGASVGILDFPHYTRPASFRDWDVPSVLLGGNHEEIRHWRRRAALKKTLRNRPDVLKTAPLAEEDREILRELESE